MAKRIKTLKCPQCDSVHITEKRTDFYECQSCGTDFFLDSDDITIHHKMPIHPQWKKILMFAVLGFAIFFFIAVFFPLIFSKNSPQMEIKNAPPITAEVEKEKWDIERVIPFVNTENQPMTLIIGKKFLPSKKWENRDNPQFYYAIIDVKTEREISVKNFPELNQIKNINRISEIYLEDEMIYIIVNEYLLFKFNPKSYELSQVNPQSFHIEEINAGFSKIQTYNIYPNIFKVMTNLGKEFYFSPILSKVYEEKKMHEIIRKKPADAQPKTAYQFSSKSTNFPDEKIQLIRYTYWHSKGYPTERPRFEWRKDYGRSGIFTENDRYAKRLINHYMFAQTRLIDYKDVTPNRYYFSPEVLFFDEERLLISFKQSLSPDALTQVQLLKTSDFTPIWTIAMEELDRISVVIPTADDGFLLHNHKESILLDKNGKILKKQDLYDLFEM